PAASRLASGGAGARPGAASAWLLAGARSRLESTSVPSRSKPTMSKGNWAMGAGLGSRLWNPQPNGGMRRLMSEGPRPIAAIVLAAGKGTRMKSTRHKVLHEIAGRPMIEHLLDSLGQLAPERTIVVVGEGRDQLEAALGARAEFVVQDPQLGTGHAVQQAEGALAGFEGDVLILYGDVPFVRPETMRAMIDRLREGDSPQAVVLGFTPPDALAYGRVIADGGRV